MSSIIAAFNSGLGVRKLDWNADYFVYLADGQIMNGNLNEPCRIDSPRVAPFAFDTDIAAWEVVDQSYLLKIELIKAVAQLHNITDAKGIASACKALKIALV